ncbi:(-)-isopiperitenol/(-)-carveol dehydrogenase, mitochondrial-like [Glycine soja]|uniref:(-)-isopiperitenol/(-)-carveol dehydrogenase, mitochondrial n=1 Tax=Glycine soja TaxID=3848 RepID=A0A445L1I2_GLYSO|nr:(-)-isopiperitenol/(-)-carveol dehydrogenase, mitochondrial-like [Glycine soja]RZC17002.1 (-)-isopiperitenol/(-)-carveol dehydrogenase, mitochondrial [Glycine soja]
MAESANSIHNSGQKKLAGKVAIITGGASGIGEETARLFAHHGARMVVIADIQDDLGIQVAASIGSHRCSYVRCDVTDEDQVKNLVDSTVNAHGQLDIMFSNAGILSPSDQTILDLDFSAYDRLLAVNARGMAACVKHAARSMVERRVRGSIVCTASVSASHGGLRRTDYVMSKHAVKGLMHAASAQLGAHGVRVNCVSPSGLTTPLTRAAHAAMETKELQKQYAQSSRLKGVFLTPKHVADAVLFLACGDSEFVTGHDLVVDGCFDGV